MKKEQGTSLRPTAAPPNFWLPGTCTVEYFTNPVGLDKFYEAPLMTSPNWSRWDPTLSKAFSAEAALLNNLLWNEVWTLAPEARFHVLVCAECGRADFFGRRPERESEKSS